ncbi:MAG: Crp/Fnr family transcriptional regulator [Termitinemataceae bacterium]|nr:MAG: Crp/Fnr family transcriptional regulator [Termitinemataceae bacterium]
MANNSLEATTRDYNDGEIIFSEFEQGDCFFLIQSGRVELTKIIGTVQKTLDVLNPSEMFGEMALLENTPRSASAVALGSVKLMVFDRDNFSSLLMTNTPIAMRLLKMFTKRIYDAKRRFMILTLDDPIARVGDVFIMLSDNIQLDPKSPTPDRRELKSTVEDIARWAAISPNEAQSALNNFMQQGVLEQFPQKELIVIKNIKYFERMITAIRSHKAV